MNLKRIIVGKGSTNCYILWDVKGRGVIVDPGANSEVIINYIMEHNIRPKAIILTHYHYDHILAVNDLKREFKLPVWIHENGINGLKDPKINLSAIRPVSKTSILADRGLKDGEIIIIGDLKLEIIYTPGHTSSDICIKSENVLLTGDTLFKNSVGRSDLQESSYEKLKDSILNKLMPLEDELLVYPGHYSETELGVEKIKNPRIKEMLNLKEN